MLKTISPTMRFQTAAEPAGDNNGITALRQTVSKWSILMLFAVVPCAAATALLAGNAWLMPTVSSFIVAACATAVWRLLGGGAALCRYVVAVATVVQVSLLVLAAAGPWQIDFHMIYFAALGPTETRSR